MSDQLKPCPFCGGSALLTQRDISQKWIVRCPYTDCQANQEGWTSREDAVEAWNRRDAEPAMREALEATIGFCVAFREDQPDWDRFPQVGRLFAKATAALLRANPIPRSGN